jgi:predicted HicB family RNase H-like nuclease
MSKTVKMGRPSLPAKEKRGKFINTRVSPEEYKAIHEAIKSSGVAKTEWVRQKLLSAAHKKRN